MAKKTNKPSQKGKQGRKPHRGKQQRALETPETKAMVVALRKKWRKLSHIERGQRLLALIACGCTGRGLAGDLHQSGTNVRRHLELMKLPPEDQKAIEQGMSAKQVWGRLSEERRLEHILRLIRLEQKTGAVSDRAARVIFELLKRATWEQQALEQLFAEIDRQLDLSHRIRAYPLLEKGMHHIPVGMKDPKKIIRACEPRVQLDYHNNLPLGLMADTVQWVARIADAMTPDMDTFQTALRKAKKLLKRHFKMKAAY